MNTRILNRLLRSFLLISEKIWKSIALHSKEFKSPNNPTPTAELCGYRKSHREIKASCGRLYSRSSRCEPDGQRHQDILHALSWHPLGQDRKKNGVRSKNNSLSFRENASIGKFPSMRRLMSRTNSFTNCPFPSIQRVSTVTLPSALFCGAAICPGAC